MNQTIQIRQDPIFIVGFPRSGTTLMQALLSAQPGMQSFPENQYFMFFPPGFDDRAIDAKTLETLFARLHTKVSPTCAKAAQAVAAAGSLRQKPLYEMIVQDMLLQQTGGGEVSQLRWIDKSVAHAYHLETIHALYPAARFVRMLRNPLHSFASRRGIHPEAGTGWGEGWRPVECYAEEWMAMMRSTEAFALRNSNLIMSVRLEDLVADPAALVKQVCEFAGAAFEPAALENYRDGAAPLFGAGNFWKNTVADQPISSAIANRENAPELTPYERFRVGQMLGGMMAHYGYRLHAGKPSALGPEETEIVMKTVDYFRLRKK